MEVLVNEKLGFLTVPQLAPRAGTGMESCRSYGSETGIDVNDLNIFKTLHLKEKMVSFSSKS